ncbi:MAG: hypothetical protein GWM98_10075, partial [Nitrospinaceae bacterium]|nr:VCBS repeat-containing protein [Nitrospinaceae bacterium]NIR54769.1 VCBS repeat-containing protein [Nitrospinaceae bacterium]NIS85195.1 VCBS repeat-containing protein [Nitrospinaceae bacterium]NIT82005.1 VCBS repeat-containing protein [Nitrospinaceae bacterium]NIU44269.1 VCBS repeat-containing protein [Nitrospinaceae bacterium]
CFRLENPGDIRDCMVTRMALLAVERKDPALCDKLAGGHALGRTVCRKFFQAKPVQRTTEQEIPLKSLFNLLLQGKANGTFRDVTEPTRVDTGEWSWNAKFADLDNDEWQDLYVVNGVLVTQEFSSNRFFHNLQGREFAADQEAFGLDDFDHSSAYTLLDIDNDGDLDLVANTLYGPFKVFWNNHLENHSV